MDISDNNPSKTDGSITWDVSFPSSLGCEHEDGGGDNTACSATDEQSDDP